MALAAVKRDGALSVVSCRHTRQSKELRIWVQHVEDERRWCTIERGRDAQSQAQVGSTVDGVSGLASGKADDVHGRL